MEAGWVKASFIYCRKSTATSVMSQGVPRFAPFQPSHLDMHDSDIDPQRLRAETFVETVEYHPVLGSTNDRARLAAQSASAELPLLIIAEEQTAGRGQRKRDWWTGRGNLAFSLLLDADRHTTMRDKGPPLALLAAVAVAQTIQPQMDRRAVGLHWPNDVYVEDRKIAGILVEVLADGRPIVGVGLNVNSRLADVPETLQATATTMAELSGRTFHRIELLIDLMARFESTLQLAASDPQRIAEGIDELCLQKGQRLSVETGDKSVTGQCAGIAADGALLLKTESGQQQIRSGSLIRLLTAD